MAHFLGKPQIPPSGSVISRCVEIRIIQLHCTLRKGIPPADPNLRYTKLSVITVGVYAMLDQFCQTKKKRADVHPLSD